MAPSKTLSDSAKQTIAKNPSALGDPVSLKAEKSGSSPTPDDKGAPRRETLSDKAKKNASMLGDPVSLKAEKSESEPTEHDRGTKGGKGVSKL